MTQYEVAEESIPKAFLGGLIGALIGAIIQGIITAATQMNFGLVAIGIGYLAALGVRFLGNGNSSVFGMIGGVCALVGALTGHFVAISLLIAKEIGGSYADGFSIVAENLSIVPENIGIMSWLFVALAAYFGYKYSTAETGAD